MYGWRETAKAYDWLQCHVNYVRDVIAAGGAETTGGAGSVKVIFLFIIFPALFKSRTTPFKGLVELILWPNLQFSGNMTF